MITLFKDALTYLNNKVWSGMWPDKTNRRDYLIDIISSQKLSDNEKYDQYRELNRLTDHELEKGLDLQDPIDCVINQHNGNLKEYNKDLKLSLYWFSYYNNAASCVNELESKFNDYDFILMESSPLVQIRKKEDFKDIDQKDEVWVAARKEKTLCDSDFDTE